MNTLILNQKEKFQKKYYHPIQDIIQKPKNRIYTTTILSFLTVSVFAWYAIRPTMQTILSLRREIQDSMQLNEQMEMKITNLVEAQAIYQKNAERFQLINDALPENSEVLDIIYQVRQLATSMNLKILNLSAETTNIIDEETTKTIHKQETKSELKTENVFEAEILTTPIKVNLEGTYDEIQKFLSNLYSLRRIIEIADISIQQPSTNKGNTITMNLKLDAYYMRTK